MRADQTHQEHQLLKKVRALLLLFIAGLALSGLTAFPLETELALSNKLVRELHIEGQLSAWLQFVYAGVKKTNSDYPFIAYGTDWLAFAHLLLAVLFIGPYRDPVKNIWVIQFGVIACCAVFPVAFIAGEIRGIPLMWRCIDCSFGLVGGMLLMRILFLVKRIQNFNYNQIKT